MYFNSGTRFYKNGCGQIKCEVSVLVKPDTGLFLFVVLSLVQRAWPNEESPTNQEGNPQTDEYGPYN